MAGIEGARFSHNYVAKGEPIPDSPRLRLRLMQLVSRQKLFVEPKNYRYSEYLMGELGIDVPSSSNHLNWHTWYREVGLHDLLDTITLTTHYIPGNDMPRWLATLQRIMDEENIGYSVDQEGGVHFRIDAEFDNNHRSTVAALDANRYNAALEHLEASQRSMDQTPPEPRDAIRHTFDCAETLFRLLFPDEARLEVGGIRKTLKPVIDARCASVAERNASAQLAEAFANWVISSHQYRHAQGDEQPVQPSIEFAVLHISMGRSFARWLAELDTKIKAEG